MHRFFISTAVALIAVTVPMGVACAANVTYRITGTFDAAPQIDEMGVLAGLAGQPFQIVFSYDASTASPDQSNSSNSGTFTLPPTSTLELTSGGVVVTSLGENHVVTTAIFNDPTDNVGVTSLEPVSAVTGLALPPTTDLAALGFRLGFDKGSLDFDPEPDVMPETLPLDAGQWEESRASLMFRALIPGRGEAPPSLYSRINATVEAVVLLPCVGDLDADGDTDVFDFGLFADGFGAGPDAGYSVGDLNGDGGVDVLDFAIFVGGFGCGPVVPPVR